MADWSLLEREWPAAPPPLPYDPYQYAEYDPYYQEKLPQKQEQPPVHHVPSQAQHFLSPPSPTLTLLLPPQQHMSPPMMPRPLPMPVPTPLPYMPTHPKVDNPREIRNKAEKQRRDKMNQSIAELAAIVPPVVAASRKIDKTGVLRLTAHFIRTDYVFDPGQRSGFTTPSTLALLRLLKGFMLTVTYKGLVVVVSQNVNEYLGYTELELLGQNIFNITHDQDRQILRQQLMPKSQMLGQNGELLMPDDDAGRSKVAQMLANDQRSFVIRFKKLGQRSEPSKYVTCHVQGSFKLSDRASRGNNRCCQIVRRARARGDNPCSSGNDVVFIGVVCPTTEAFINESALESFKMEYRTRHSIDGEIIQCEQRIALVTGYMTSEVNGVNAMNFIHRDEVRWVIVALREMYNQNQLYGESCYRLMMKNGQFIYMRTRGRLDVDPASRAVTSFVCTNTVVEEDEGKHLIKMMKDRFTLQVDSGDELEVDKDTNDSQTVAVEDPRQLEKVILNLVTNLPSPQSRMDHPRSVSPDRGESPSRRLALIPPKKERIVSAIEKIYSVIKTIPKQPSILQEELVTEATQLSLTPSTIRSEPPDLGFYNESCFQMHSSDTELNSEAACSPTTSDVEYIPSLVVTNSCDESMAVSNDALDTRLKIAYSMHSPPPLGISTIGYQEQILAEPISPGPSSAGLKRPNKFEDQDTSTKKKIIDVASEQIANEQSDHESPTLETFFDETALNTEIESAIDLMEEIIDPSFLDLLISKEVQETLDTIESEPGGNQSN